MQQVIFMKNHKAICPAKISMVIVLLYTSFNKPA